MLVSFTDPQTITISAVTSPLPRVETDDRKAVYQSADGLIALSADHSVGKARTRHVLRVDLSKIAPDPFRPSENTKVSMSEYIVFDVPAVGAGFSITEQLALWTGFKTQITASSDLLVSKLLAGES